MSSRAWQILPAIIIAACTAARASDTDIGSFGPWRITLTPENHAYNLVGTSEGQFFKLQCHPDHTGTSLFFPIWTKDRRAYPGTEIVVMVWSDAAHAKAITFLVNRGLLAMAVNSPQYPGTNVQDFLEVLASAKTTFAFSYLQQTFEFDARFLPVARRKFTEMCALNFKQ